MSNLFKAISHSREKLWNKRMNLNTFASIELGAWVNRASRESSHTFALKQVRDFCVSLTAAWCARVARNFNRKFVFSHLISLRFSLSFVSLRGRARIVCLFNHQPNHVVKPREREMFCLYFFFCVSGYLDFCSRLSRLLSSKQTISLEMFPQVVRKLRFSF